MRRNNRREMGILLAIMKPNTGSKESQNIGWMKPQSRKVEQNKRYPATARKLNVWSYIAIVSDSTKPVMGVIALAAIIYRSTTNNGTTRFLLWWIGTQTLLVKK
jgi:hypothetical protein